MHSRLRAPLKILIVKPSSLGDVIHALPVLRLIKRAHPHAEVYWWISSELKGLVEHDPDLAGIFVFPRRGWGKGITWQQFAMTVRKARSLSFDWVIDLQGLARSGVLSWFARGQMTIGVNDPREFAYAFYDRAVPRPSYHSHAVDWYLEVLRELRVPVHNDFTWLHANPAAQASVAAKWKPQGRKWVILNPGARWLNKRWSAAQFGRLAGLLVNYDASLNLVVLGSRDERPIAAQIAAVAPDRTLNLAGETSFAELMEWVRIGDLMVTNDTGPMHIRAAYRKPQIGLFGPTEPRRTGPYGQLSTVLQARDLPCVPCMRAKCRHPEQLACLKAITAEQVFEKAKEILRGLPPVLQERQEFAASAGVFTEAAKHR